MNMFWTPGSSLAPSEKASFGIMYYILIVPNVRGH